MRKITYKSQFGRLILITHKGQLIYCNWDSPECVAKLAKIEKLVEEPETQYPLDENILKEVILQLDEYFKGIRKEFNVPMKLYGSEFQKSVWKYLFALPYSATVAYKEIAGSLGKENGFRAVAQACGANPIAVIIPCHRVVASDGGLGGYSGGIDKKISLLNLETTLLKR